MFQGVDNDLIFERFSGYRTLTQVSGELDMNNRVFDEHICGR